MKKTLLKLICVLSFLLCSMTCIVAYPFAVALGIIITGYPDWCSSGDTTKTDISQAFGFSPWLDWQSHYEKLGTYIPKVGEADSKTYQGRFRIVVYGQRIVFMFDDSAMSIYNFFNYYGEGGKGKKLEMKDESVLKCTPSRSNSFEYKAHFLAYVNPSTPLFIDEVSPSNASHSLFESIDYTSFRYILTVNGKQIINERLYNRFYKPQFVAETVLKQYPWIPYAFTSKTDLKTSSSSCYNKNFFYLTKDGSVIDCTKEMLPQFFEGVVLRNVDPDTRTVTLNLIDSSAPSGVVYYVKMVVGETSPLWQTKNSDNPNKDISGLRRGNMTFYKVDSTGEHILRHFADGTIIFHTNESD